MESPNTPAAANQIELPEMSPAPLSDSSLQTDNGPQQLEHTVVSPSETVGQATEEESFLVENQRATLRGWGDLDIGIVMAEPALAANRADFHAAQIVAGSDTTEAGRSLVAELMQYEHYRRAFKESAVKYYAEMPERLRPALEPGLTVANAIVVEAEARFGVVEPRSEIAPTREEIETLHLLYGSRIDIVRIPTLEQSDQLHAVEIYDQKFGSLGVFQGSFQEAFDHAVIQVDKKEKQIDADFRQAMESALTHAKSVSSALNAPSVSRPEVITSPSAGNDASTEAFSAHEQADVKPAPPVVGEQLLSLADQDAAEPVPDPVVETRGISSTRKNAQENSDNAANSIWVGPPRPNGEAIPPEVSNIDKDALLARLDHETQADKSVLYTLDGEPAFIDRGTRLEMADGASQNEEKVLAALLTAAQYYRGRIELTGSEAFQRTAIGLIAQHQLNVTMKNPGQQAQLEDARKALHVAPVAKDAVTGDSPPPFSGPSQPETAPVQAAKDSKVADNELLSNSTVEQSKPTDASDQLQSTVHLSNTTTSAQVAVETKPDTTPNFPPEIHQSTQAAANGITGKVLDFGNAPFRFDENNGDSVFIKMRTKTGVQTFWGKELAGLLRDTRIQQNSVVTLKYLGKEPVVVRVPIKDADGAVKGFQDKDAHRNQWSLAMVGGNTVRTGRDEGVKLTAFDAQRFGHVQQTLITRLRIDVPLPDTPKDGLFWLAPDGQGSDKKGDELTAPRPTINRHSAGQPVMSSWSADGQLDMALVLSDGPYMQGVLRHRGHYQHVLVSLPDKPDGPPMIFNVVTADGLVPIGSGNAINRSGGEAVSRENIAFKLDGDPSARIAKLDNPAEMNPALHARLGFDERWRDDNTLPKSAPAVAPTAHPGDPRPA